MALYRRWFDKRTMYLLIPGRKTKGSKAHDKKTAKRINKRKKGNLMRKIIEHKNLKENALIFFKKKK